MMRIEYVLSLSEDYSQQDLRVVLEGIHLQQSAQQALMNTYALRANLKDIDPEEFLPPRRLEDM